MRALADTDHIFPGDDELSLPAFKRALSSFASGVTVMTAVAPDGTLYGMTVSAFSSLSLNPPLILACGDSGSRTTKAILELKKFTVHILDESQAGLAREFALPGANRDEISSFSITDGYAELDEYHTAFMCDLRTVFEGGDHIILIGAVRKISDLSANRKPLIYYRSRFHNLELV